MPEDITVNKIYVSNTVNIPTTGYATLFYSERADTYQHSIDYINSKDVTVMITEMGDHFIWGTFSGTLSTNDGTKHSLISEG